MTAVLIVWALGALALSLNVLLRRYPWGMAVVTPLWVLIPFGLLVVTLVSKRRKDGTYDPK